MSMPPSQPQPENAGSKGYRCLLHQHVQKLRKPPPVYQTQNEGSDHNPRFRSTVSVDGVSYTSSSTFQLRKMAELDVSKIAYTAIMQKEKTEALQFIQQDKTYCKSIMVEFASKKNIRIPVYQTKHLNASVPVFHSTLLFNGGTYQGDIAKSKKEAEQLVARSVIINILALESDTDMTDIVNSKLRRNKEIERIQISSHVLKAQAGYRTSTMAPASATATGVPQPIIPQQLVEPVTPAAPVVVQPSTKRVKTESVDLDVPLETRRPTPRVSTKSNLVQGTMAPPTIPHSVAPQPIVPQLSVGRAAPAIPVAIQRPTQLVSTSPIHAFVRVPVVSQQPIKAAVAEPRVLPPVPYVVVNNSCTPVVSTTMVEIPATTNVSPLPQPEASPAQSLEYIALVNQASDKKRRRTQLKNARKKMRANAQ
ncbi:putative double-stranded RNA-binding domain-containing protein [Helianthus annuus]|nr:putative double-stranded RNA-binding domain-containing protein [Helianthus annuus]